MGKGSRIIDFLPRLLCVGATLAERSASRGLSTNRFLNVLFAAAPRRGKQTNVRPWRFRAALFCSFVSTLAYAGETPQGLEWKRTLEPGWNLVVVPFDSAGFPEEWADQKVRVWPVYGFARSLDRTDAPTNDFRGLLQGEGYWVYSNKPLGLTFQKAKHTRAGAPSSSWPCSESTAGASHITKNQAFTRCHDWLLFMAKETRYAQSLNQQEVYTWAPWLQAYASVSPQDRLIPGRAYWSKTKLSSGWPGAAGQSERRDNTEASGPTARTQSAPSPLGRTEKPNMASAGDQTVLSGASSQPSFVDVDRILESHGGTFQELERTNYQRAKELRDLLLRDDPNSGAVYQVEYEDPTSGTGDSSPLTTEEPQESINPFEAGQKSDSKYLARFERVWAYTQGILLAQVSRQDADADHVRAQNVARYLCEQAVKGVDRGRPIIKGWHFSWNTKGDTWKDARLVTGANAWVVDGLGKFLTSAAFDNVGEEAQPFFLDCYQKALLGLETHRWSGVAQSGRAVSLMTAGWTTIGLNQANTPWNIRNREGNRVGPKGASWAYYDVLDAVGYDTYDSERPSKISQSFATDHPNHGQPHHTFKTLSKEDFWAIKKEVKTQNVVTEHNIDVLSVLNHALSHADALELDRAHIQAWRDEIRDGIFFVLSDNRKIRWSQDLHRALLALPPGSSKGAHIHRALDHEGWGRVATGGSIAISAPVKDHVDDSETPQPADRQHIQGEDQSFSFVRSVHTAVDNCSWLSLAVDHKTLEPAYVDALAYCLEFTALAFAKNIAFKNDTYYGAHYFFDSFKDPYIAPTARQEQSYHLEATTGLIAGLRTFAEHHPNHPKAGFFRDESDTLWVGAQAFIDDHGFLYSSQRIVNLSTQLTSSTALIWYIDLYESIHPTPSRPLVDAALAADSLSASGSESPELVRAGDAETNMLVPPHCSEDTPELKVPGQCRSVCDDAQEIPPKECFALQALYEATDGNNWSRRARWLETNEPCAWERVRCESGHVVRLSLSDNNLTGHLPPELSDLAELRTLRLAYNKLTGTLPSSWGTLTDLTTLTLQYNDLFGPLPPEWAGMTKLSRLDLRWNRLNGPLPAEWGALQELKDLNLYTNEFRGSIPDSWLGMTNIERIDLRFNAEMKREPSVFEEGIVIWGPVVPSWTPLHSVLHVLGGVYKGAVIFGRRVQLSANGAKPPPPSITEDPEDPLRILLVRFDFPSTPPTDPIYTDQKWKELQAEVENDVVALSNNLLQVTVETTEVIHLEEPALWDLPPEPRGQQKWETIGRSFLPNAIEKAQSLGANVSDSDVVMALLGENGRVSFAWLGATYAGPDGFITEGVIFDRYSFVPSTATAHILVHELIHHFDLPDLYWKGGVRHFDVGPWGLMGTENGGLSAWSRVALGWVEPKTVDTDRENEQLRVGEVVRIPIAHSNEYYLLENRQKIGPDVLLPGSGLLIWHVTPDRTDSTGALTTIDLVEASSTQDLESRPSSQAFKDGTDPFFLGNPSAGYRNRFDATTSSGQPAGFYIDDISASSSVMTFDVHFHEPAGNNTNQSTVGDALWSSTVPSGPHPPQFATAEHTVSGCSGGDCELARSWGGLHHRYRAKVAALRNADATAAIRCNPALNHGTAPRRAIDDEVQAACEAAEASEACLESYDRLLILQSGRLLLDAAQTVREHATEAWGYVPNWVEHCQTVGEIFAAPDPLLGRGIEQTMRCDLERFSYAYLHSLEGAPSAPPVWFDDRCCNGDTDCKVQRPTPTPDMAPAESTTQEAGGLKMPTEIRFELFASPPSRNLVTVEYRSQSSSYITYSLSSEKGFFVVPDTIAPVPGAKGEVTLVATDEVYAKTEAAAVVDHLIVRSGDQILLAIPVSMGRRGFDPVLAEMPEPQSFEPAPLPIEPSLPIEGCPQDALVIKYDEWAYLVEPSVTKSDGSEPMVLRVMLKDARFPKIILDPGEDIEYRGAPSQILEGPDAGRILLRDDGVYPDRVEGDGSFAAGEFYYVGNEDVGHFHDDPHSPKGVDIRGFGRLFRQGLDDKRRYTQRDPRFGVLGPSNRRITIRTLSDQVQISNHFINVCTGLGISGRALSERSELDTPGLTQREVDDLRSFGNTLYEVVRRRFDFFTFYSDYFVEPLERSMGVPHGMTMRSTSQENGVPRKAWIFLGNMDHGLNSKTMTHEILHYWSGGLYRDIASDGAHFFNHSTAGSLLGGIPIVEQADGTYRRNCQFVSEGPTQASMLDLYSMSLVRPDNLIDPLALNVSVAHEDTDQINAGLGCVERVSGPITTYTLNSIPAATRTRLSNAERPFHITLGFTGESLGRFFTETEMRFYDILAEHYTKKLQSHEPAPQLRRKSWVPVHKFFRGEIDFSADVLD